MLEDVETLCYKAMRRVTSSALRVFRTLLRGLHVMMVPCGAYNDLKTGNVGDDEVSEGESSQDGMEMGNKNL